MNLTELLTRYNVTQAEVCRRYGIPVHTMQSWRSGDRKPPEYVLLMIARLIEIDYGGMDK